MVLIPVALLGMAYYAQAVIHPVGIANGGNYCYMSALLQALFHLPAVRDRVLQNQSASPVHTALGSLFYRLLTAEEGKVQDLNVDLYPVAEALMDAQRKTPTSNRRAAFTPGVADDPDAFWNWLIGDHLPDIGDALFNLEIEETLSYSGYILNKSQNNGNTVMAKAEGLAGAFIDRDLDITEPIDDFVLNPEDYKNTYDPTVYEGGTIRDYLYMSGLESEQRVTITKRTRVTNTPQVLHINASKFTYTSARDRTWQADVPTNYRRTFDLNGATYHLHTMVIYRHGHYVARACVDPATDTWYEFDDRTATPRDASETVRNIIVPPKRDSGKSTIKEMNDPYVFFYVREDVLEQWKTQPPIQPAEVGSTHKVVGQVTHALSHAVQLMMDLTGSSPPRFEKLKLEGPFAESYALVPLAP